jgi:multiple sugar transport system permease protein
MQKSLLGRVVWSFIIILVILLSLFPLIYLIITSIKPANLFFSTPPKFFFFPNFNGYKALISDGYFRFFLNSFEIATISSLISLGLGALAAFGFVNYRFKVKNILFFLILMTRAYMPVTTLIPIYWGISYFHLQDTKIGLILIYVSFQLPLVVYILRSFINEIPLEIRESASLDGCNDLKVFHKIVLPLAKPGIVAAGILVFVFNWNEFLFALVLTSFRSMTAPVAIMAFIESEGILQWGQVAVLGVTMILPIIIIMIFFNKYLIKGMMAGAVKG